MSRTLLCVLLLALHASAGASAQTPGKKYALLIGVKAYEDSNFARLNYTENDVVRLAELLKKQGYETTVLSDSQEAERLPTKRNIIAYFEKFAADKHIEDSVLFAFAGHGLQFVGEKSSYFLPRDAKLEEPETMVSLQMIYDKLHHCRARVKLMFVDACRSHAEKKGNARSAIPNDLPPPPKGVCAIFSCSAGQSAYEDNDLRHGVFFFHLLEGLRGRAKNEDGDVTILRLADYATQKVEKSGYNQRPVLKGEEFSNGVLMRVGRLNLEMPKLPFVYKEMTNSIGMKLVYIAPGKFKIGTSAQEQETLLKQEPMLKMWLDAEGPQHEVEISEGFYIGKFVVTQEEYEKVTGKTPSKFSAKGSGAARVTGLDTRRFPVEQVSWEDAKEFCRLLSASEKSKLYTLPTEAEWEYACRADTTQRYNVGDELSEKHANFGLHVSRTESVDTYPANPWGLHDMHGNVAQWCEDWFNKREYRRGTCKDPEGPADGTTRILRGGRWDLAPLYCRSACRAQSEPTTHAAGVGFRIVLRLSDKRLAKQTSN